MSRRGGLRFSVCGQVIEGVASRRTTPSSSRRGTSRFSFGGPRGFATYDSERRPVRDRIPDIVGWSSRVGCSCTKGRGCRFQLGGSGPRGWCPVLPPDPSEPERIRLAKNRVRRSANTGVRLRAIRMSPSLMGVLRSCKLSTR